MFDSSFSYKLAINSTPQDKVHRYSISQDLLQYNLKTGLKAFQNWFYSFTMQFKTQIFNSYPQDSEERKASFLSPADFNVGLGMTYNKVNKYKTLKLSASVAPVSFNLKTCIDSRVDHVQFNIPNDRNTLSEIGSNAEITFDWQIISNISYNTRLFLFTNYKNFTGDWENTFNFQINRFLSTQLYIHLRYDSASEPTASKWNRWMMKEILSFGLSYTFSSKV